jgi:hypothetical protein
LERPGRAAGPRNEFEQIMRHGFPGFAPAARSLPEQMHASTGPWEMCCGAFRWQASAREFIASRPRSANPCAAANRSPTSRASRRSSHGLNRRHRFSLHSWSGRVGLSAPGIGRGSVLIAAYTARKKLPLVEKRSRSPLRVVQLLRPSSLFRSGLRIVVRALIGGIRRKNHT